VIGLAYAVTRDIGSFLRYETHDDAGNANPLALRSSSTASGARTPPVPPRPGCTSESFSTSASMRQAARQLVRERFMLEEDAQKFIRAAEESDVLR
jgi:hypothetical protein